MLPFILALQATQAPTQPENVTLNANVSAPATGASGAFGVEDLIFGPGTHSARLRAALQKKVGSLMADGRCEDAKNTALKAGDLQLAQQAKDLCTPKSQQ
jgi:hypothetical protein